MKTHVIIPVEDLEALRTKAENQLKIVEASLYPNKEYLAELAIGIAIYDKILTHYRKVNLSEEDIALTLTSHLQEVNPYTSITPYMEGYKQAIKDIKGK